MNDFKRKAFDPKDLEFVSPAPPPDDPPLRLGDWCRLISGSPPLLVVDFDEKLLTVATEDGKETQMSHLVLRRI